MVNRKGLVKTGARPGMTQLINFFSYGELNLVDLPGYGYAAAPGAVREQFPAMMREYFERRANLKLVLLLLDIRRDPGDLDIQVANLLADLSIPTALVLTKSDKESGNGRTNRRKAVAEALGLEPGDLFLTSADKGTGLSELWKMIRDQLR
jgi:GTP-binding protein